MSASGVVKIEGTSKIVAAPMYSMMIDVGSFNGGTAPPFL